MDANDGIDADAMRRAAAILAEAERVVVLTGAGVSAESGVPTFRGEVGLWKRYRPEELATPEAFARDPRLVWEWYDWRRAKIASCRPNAAHRALARWALARSGVRLVTQNVDGLHTVAARAEAGGGGPDPALPLELHGSLFRVRCTACGDRIEHRDRIETGEESDLPRCTQCDGLLRPDVVWFGESLDAAVLDAAFRAAAGADACLVVGTSAVVHPAASLPLETHAAGGRVVEVNPEPTPLTTRAEVSVRAPAGAAVPGILFPGGETG